MADKYDMQVNWALKVDLKTGRPVVDPHFSPDTSGPDVIAGDKCPTALDAKDGLPPSFDPHSGLLFISTNHVCTSYEPFQVEVRRDSRMPARC